MHVHPSQSSPHEPVGLDEHQHVVVIDLRELREFRQQGENLGTAIQSAASEFADYERMALDQALFESECQGGVALAQMVDPNRRVDEHSMVASLGDAVAPAGAVSPCRPRGLDVWHLRAR